MPQGAGRLASTLVTDGAATLTAFRVHSYDALGRPTEIGRSIAGAPDPEYVTGAEYDAAGRLATMRYPTTGGAAALVVGYQYHEGTPQLERISDSAGRTYAQFTAYEVGGPGSVTYGDGSVLTDFTYNPQSARLDGLVTRSAVAAPGDRAGEVVSHTLTETPEGDLSDLWDAQAGFRLKLPSAQQTHYAYDETHRLRGERLSPQTPGATAPTPFTVTLDPARANRILSVNAAGAERSFAHDANGNIVSSWDLTSSPPVSRTFEYDAFDRPTRITTGAAVANFAYDEDGSTIRKTSATEVVFRPGEHFEVVNGKAHASIFANGLRIATVVGNGSEIRYYHRDRLGSVVAVTGTSGLPRWLAWRGSYQPFGGILEESGTLTSADVRYLFAGYRYDSDVRLYDLGARWYDPGIGRFTTYDPLLFPNPWDPLELNGYAYTRNNPVNRVDPSGTQDVGIPYVWGSSPWGSSSSSAASDFGHTNWLGSGSAQGSGASATGSSPTGGASGGSGSIGQPGVGESMIPVWGNGRASIDHFQNGRWVWGTIHAALAVSDVFLVKALVTGVVGGVFKGLTAGAERRLIHLTSETGAAGIESSGRLIGKGGIFALPESAAGRSATENAILTGLTPGSTTNVVSIPGAAMGAFQRALPLGPYSALKALGGVRFTAPGVINMSTGAFTQTGSILLPYAAVYGPDLLIYGAIAAEVYGGVSGGH